MLSPSNFLNFQLPNWHSLRAKLWNPNNFDRICNELSTLQWVHESVSQLLVTYLNQSIMAQQNWLGNALIDFNTCMCLWSLHVSTTVERECGCMSVWVWIVVSSVPEICSLELLTRPFSNIIQSICYCDWQPTIDMNHFFIGSHRHLILNDTNLNCSIFFPFTLIALALRDFRHESAFFVLFLSLTHTRMWKKNWTKHQLNVGSSEITVNWMR